MPHNLGGIPHCGRGRHARFCREDDGWAVEPAAPDWLAAPYLDNGFTLKAEAEPWLLNTNYDGGVDRSAAAAIQHAMTVAGDYTFAAWPQVTCAMLHAALDRNPADDDLYSHVFDHYTPVDPRRYYGVVVERLTLRATGTGDGDVQLTAGLRGQREVEQDDLEVGDFDYTAIDAVPFMHAHSVLQLNTVDVADVEDWELTVDNVVEIGPWQPHAETDLGVVSYLVSCSREITLTLTKLNRDANLNEILRAAGQTSFEALFTHPLGHVLHIQLPRLIVPRSPEDGTPDKKARENPTLTATRAIGEASAIIWGCDLIAGGATTLEPLTTTTEEPTTTTEEPTTTTAGE